MRRIRVKGKWRGQIQSFAPAPPIIAEPKFVSASDRREMFSQHDIYRQLLRTTIDPLAAAVLRMEVEGGDILTVPANRPHGFKVGDTVTINSSAVDHHPARLYEITEVCSATSVKVRRR